MSKNINAQAVGCTNTMYLAQGYLLPSPKIGIYRINNSPNPFTYPLIKQHPGVMINAIAINPVNGNMYGIRYNTANFVRIDINGNFTDIGTFPGLPALNYNTGEIDPAGNYYLKATGLNNKFYKINLNTNAVTTVTLSASLELSDWAFNITDGQLYGVNLSDGRLYKVNPSTGTATPIGAAYSMLDAFGAMFGASNGEIYGVINSGGFYQFNTATGARTLISASPASGQNDGAHCVTEPISFNADLYVTKTDGKTTYTSGSTTTYTIVAGNNGLFGVQNALLSDLVPAGIPSANVTYTAVASPGSSTQVVGTQTGAISDYVSLPVGGTVTYTVTVNIPTTFTGDLVNTVTITSPTNSVDNNTSNNLATDTDTRVCVAPSTPTISAGGPTTFCTGGNVNLTSSSATGNQWYKDGAIISGATGQTYSANASGTYTVRVTNGTCQSNLSTGTVVTVNSAPPALVVSAGGPTTFCTGGNVLLTSTYNTTGAYQWYRNGTAISGAIYYEYTATTPGTYTVTRELNGCTSPASAGVAVTVNSNSTAPTVSAGGPTTFCTGGNVNLTSSSATGNQWYKDGAIISGATGQTYSANASGTYTVRVTNGTCQSNLSTGTVVTVNSAPPALVVSAGGPTTFCTGGNVLLTSTYNTTGAYQWYRNGTAISGAIYYQYTATTPGTYTVTRVLNGCTSPASAGMAVTVNSNSTAPTVSAGGPTTFCAGGNVNLTSSSATGNQWYKDGAIISGATGQTYSANASGTYTVVVTTGGCTSLASAGTSVTVNSAPPALVVSAGGPTTFCTGGNVLLTSTYNTTGAYQWYRNGTAISGAIYYEYTATTPGTYKVTRELNGCTSPASAGVAVTVNSNSTAPTVSAGGATTFCTGGSVNLTSSSATGNQWYKDGAIISGATGQTYSANASGTYTVVVTTGGCTSLASAGTSVTVNPAVAGTISASQTILSGSAPVALVFIGSTGAVQWQISTDNIAFANISGATATVYAPGALTATTYYRAVVTSAGGCSAVTNTVTITIQSGVPDLSLESSASTDSYRRFIPLNTFHKITNMGNLATDGSTITLTVVVNAGLGTFNYALPAGWALQSQSGTTFVFTTNKIMNPGDNDTIKITYTASSGRIGDIAIFNGNILNNSGGEINNVNNNSSLTITFQSN
ncbi:beta strand repeat-containing protein [Chryseobacterium formosense]|uniref:beta strand repeat-containing protein n=1 Tax=Chryseobacterium formosense TaxID=236814 RepID=UPI0009450FBB|nr:DUF11 domain-containing protein [Chryseobacterium formosense]